MSQLIPEEVVQEVLLRADIVDVIGDYVQLKRSGANAKGLCPFHQEKTPSFTVSPAKGFFYCFGCHASGDVVRFLMQYENMSFPEAVRFLAARYGVRIPEASAQQRQQESVSPLYALHQAAAAFFHECLLRDPTAQAARAACRQRRMTQEIAVRFGLGYAPAAWDTLYQAMQKQGFSHELLIQSGLAVVREAPQGAAPTQSRQAPQGAAPTQSRQAPQGAAPTQWRQGPSGPAPTQSRQSQRGAYDRFRHRLMFPIYDRLGRPIAFGGRALEGGETVHVPKYLNSPETPIFYKSRILYGFALAKAAMRQRQQGLIMEGYTDVIACHRQGVTHAVGTLGTALTEHHVGLLKGLVKEAVLVFDGDAAGGAATERSIGLFLDAGLRVRVVTLPEGEDPDSFLRQHTGEEFLHYVAEAVSFVDYLLTRAARFSDLRNPAGQADCVARLLPLLRKVESQVERRGYDVLVAERLGVPLNVLYQDMYPHHTPSGQAPYRQSARLSPPPHPKQKSPEHAILQMLCHDLHLLNHVQDQITSEDFQDTDLRTIYTILLRLASQGRQAEFPGILDEVENPKQKQLLNEMGMDEVVLSNPNEVSRALDDCLNKMRQRQRKVRGQRIKEQLRTVDDAAEQQRLLQEYNKLSKEQPIGPS